MKAFCDTQWREGRIWRPCGDRGADGGGILGSSCRPACSPRCLHLQWWCGTLPATCEDLVCWKDPGDLKHDVGYECEKDSTPEWQAAE